MCDNCIELVEAVFTTTAPARGKEANQPRVRCNGEHTPSCNLRALYPHERLRWVRENLPRTNIMLVFKRDL